MLNGNVEGFEITDNAIRAFSSAKAINGNSRGWVRTWNKAGSGPWSAAMVFTS